VSIILKEITEKYFKECT